MEARHGMRWRPLLLAFVVLVAGGLSCEEATTTNNGTPNQPDATATARPGNAEVYQRIEALTDCAALQREFDLAETNHGREIAAGPSRLAFAQIATSYMQAADKRLRDIGCYR